ncbi:MAG: PAS domain S-box protein, partial [Polyangia bacterium]
MPDHPEPREADEALRKSEERFRAIFDSTFQFTGLMTPDGILLEANRAALDFAGIATEDFVNKPFWETRWWQGNEVRVQQLKDAVARAARGEFIRYEVEVQGAGDTTTSIDFSLKPVFDSHGRVTLLVPEGRDITHRRLAESQKQAAIEALRVRESYLSAIIENQALLTFSWMAKSAEGRQFSDGEGAAGRSRRVIERVRTKVGVAWGLFKVTSH